MKRTDRVLLVLAAVAALAVAGPADDSTKTANGWLGVYSDDLSKPMLVALGIDHGVLVTRVAEESPAAKAGLELGDIIVSLDGEETGDGSDLRRAVRGRPEKKVVLAVRRRGKNRKLTATLATRELSESTFNFQWPDVPEEALREVRRVLVDVGPELKKAQGKYDGTLDSLRKDMAELRKELSELRKRLSEKQKSE